MAQVILFSGEWSEEHWNALVEANGHRDEEKHPVQGVGDGAYF